MTNLKNEFKNSNEKIIENFKEIVVESNGSEETELKDKLQSQRADLKEKVDEFKAKIAKKINDTLDKNV